VRDAAAAGRHRDVSEAELVDVVDAVLQASRALVAVAARSLAHVEGNVTIPQYRAMVVLASRGPQSAGALADSLGIHLSTLTRLCDRLVAKGLITREEEPGNRRRVTLSLTPRGKRLVGSVTATRRDEIAAILRRVPPVRRGELVVALRAFGEAAGEPADSSWAPEWFAE
jgi:DNA-binding MarR family transcriptional regulator